MSGGGGGSGWVPDVQVDCSRLLETTILNSPVSAVVSTLARHDVLPVELRDQSGKKILVATKGGQIAGSLTPISLPNIIRCIEEGWKFVAVVTEVTGGRCVVKVRPEAA